GTPAATSAGRALRPMMRSPPRSSRLPYTTLFRSHRGRGVAAQLVVDHLAVAEHDDQREQQPVHRRREVDADVPLEDRTRLVLARSEEHTSELQSRENLVCRLLLEKKNQCRVRTCC